MPRHTQPLNDLTIKTAKPKEKAYKLFDGGGLYVEVKPSGSKLWRLKFQHAGKESRTSLGAYPVISLTQARKLRDEAKVELHAGRSPVAAKKMRKAAEMALTEHTFNAVFERWYKRQAPEWTDKYAAKLKAMMEKNVLPWLGQSPVVSIEAPEILKVIRRIEESGHNETAHRALQRTGQVMKFAVAEGILLRDPTSDLKAALVPMAQTKHMAATTDPEAVAAIIRRFASFAGTATVRCALNLAPLVFTRPGELRQARWADIDLEGRVWNIPAESMKMREPHLVPLSTQAIVILNEMQPLSGHLEYVFPGARDPQRPMSEAAVNAAMRRIGIDTKTELTGHGFRALARTILHERLGYEPEVIEQQLAHKVAGPLGAAYARARFVEKRTEMMQTWADYLDGLKTEKTESKVPEASL
jgi:integrase